MGYGGWRKHTSGGLSDTFQTTGRQSDFRSNHRRVICNYPNYVSRFTIHSSALWLTLNHSKCIPLSLLHFGLFFPYVDWARILPLYLQPQYLYKYIFLNSHIEIWNSHAWREIWREIFFFFSLIQSCTQILLPNNGPLWTNF